MPVIDNSVVTFIVILAAFIVAFCLCVKLLRSDSWKIGFLLALCLVVTAPLVFMAIPTTSEPTESMICASCQETFPENYSYCPYCGKEKAPTVSLNGNGAGIGGAPTSD